MRRPILLGLAMALGPALFLGLSGCSGKTQADAAATFNSASNDAAAQTDAAMNATGNALDDAGNAVSNAGNSVKD